MPIPFWIPLVLRRCVISDILTMAGLTLAQILGKGFMVEILVVLMVAFAYFHFDLGSAETGKDTKVSCLPPRERLVCS